MWERSITRCVIFSVRQQYRFLFMSFTIARARARNKRGTGIKPGRPVEVKSRSNSRATINRDLFENDSDRSSVLSSCCERTVRMEYLTERFPNDLSSANKWKVDSDRNCFQTDLSRRVKLIKETDWRTGFYPVSPQPNAKRVQGGPREEVIQFQHQ